MKEAFWGVLIVLLGLLGIVIINLLQNVTVDNDRVYYLIKESTQASAFDSIDYGYYRLNGNIRMVKDKFVENLTRRFSENVTLGNYRIVVHEISEIPPRISLSIRSGVTSLQGEEFGIMNGLDAVIEAKYSLNDVIKFLCGEEPSESCKNKVKSMFDPNMPVEDAEGICKNANENIDDMQCMPGDLRFKGFNEPEGLNNTYCQTDRLPSNVKRTANYEECDCGTWKAKTKVVTANPTGSGNTRTYTWTFTESSEIRTLNESVSKRVTYDVCTTDLKIQTPKDPDSIKPANNPNNSGEYADCPSGGIRIAKGTIVELRPRYIPSNATNRAIKWTKPTGNNVVSMTNCIGKDTCTVNCNINSNSKCLSSIRIEAKNVGTTTITATTTKGQSATCKVTVWDGTVDSFSCSVGEIQHGSSKVISTSYSPKNAISPKFTFTSNNTNIATITGNTVTAKQAGSTKITMTDTATGKTTTCNVTVKLPPFQPPTCFIAGTQVLTEDGYKNIEDVQVGEKVLSHNDVTNVTEYKTVKKTFVHDDNTEYIYKIKIGNDVIEATGNHPFYIDGKYIEAKELKVGDKLLRSNGEYEKIKGITYYGSDAKVYNIQVEDNHNYYVGEGYLVHNKGDNPPRTCFIAGTQVTTENGYKNIEDIQVGEKVLSHNDVTNVTEYKTVKKTFVHDDNTEYIYKIKIGNDVIEATGNHPFYVDGVYKEAKELKVGDKLLRSSGKYKEIEEITYYSSDAKVYNIQVEDNHNYYVGEGYLVHNKGGGSYDSGSDSSDAGTSTSYYAVNHPDGTTTYHLDQNSAMQDANKDGSHIDTVHPDGTKSDYADCKNGTCTHPGGSTTQVPDAGGSNGGSGFKISGSKSGSSGSFWSGSSYTSSSYYGGSYPQHSQGSNYCFEAGTKVLTNVGFKNIEDIKIGDMVLSYNESKNINEYNKVIKLFKHDNIIDNIYDLVINQIHIKVTGSHRFYMFGNEWKKVEDMNLYDKVMFKDGTYHSIQSLNYVRKFDTVYNIEVENNHNYYVTENAVLVHNAK